MKVVWKYDVYLNSVTNSQGLQVITTNRGAKPIFVAKQDLERTSAQVWVEVDPNESPAAITIFSIGTGHGAVPEHAQYLGTVIDGDYVWHVYWAEGNWTF